MTGVIFRGEHFISETFNTCKMDHRYALSEKLPDETVRYKQ
jgi:hypothetical protein